MQELHMQLLDVYEFDVRSLDAQSLVFKHFQAYLNPKYFQYRLREVRKEQLWQVCNQRERSKGPKKGPPLP